MEMNMDDTDMDLEIHTWELVQCLGKQFSLELLKHRMEDTWLRIGNINQGTQGNVQNMVFTVKKICSHICQVLEGNK